MREIWLRHWFLAGPGADELTTAVTMTQALESVYCHRNGSSASFLVAPRGCLHLLLYMLPWLSSYGLLLFITPSLEPSGQAGSCSLNVLTSQPSH